MDSTTPNKPRSQAGKSRTYMQAGIAVAVLLLALVFTLVNSGGPVNYLSEPMMVMGTTARLNVVADRGDRPSQAADAAAGELRRVEAMMSSHLDASPLSRLNASAPGEEVSVPDELLAMLRKSRSLANDTAGTFDVTCLPIIKIWREAGEKGVLPSEMQVSTALESTGWENFRLDDESISKLADGAGIDLGGIAKGYGIDLATQAIRASGASAGLVDVGGDIRCFGLRGNARWRVGLQSPFDESLIATVSLTDAAVCTSGNYRRFSEIDGKRYSHIVDPRTGWPANATPSVTVVARSAVVADAWATSLSVLGEDGLKLLPEDSDIEAALVIGSPDDYEVVTSAGFSSYFEQAPTVPVREVLP